jgi:phospholipid/cholesterol/gamma-HCH transport system ATP-binding protein
MDAIITLEDVWVSSEGFDIIKGVSVSFPRGKSTIIAGPSGCGKSSLLKAAAAIIPAAEGKVLYSGQDVTGMNQRELAVLQSNTGFVFQDAALWANRSMYQNVSIPVEYHFPDLTAGEVRQRVMAVLERTGLDDQSGLRPSRLSTGEQKVVSFCRALVIDPDVIFMDEPTQSVDRAKRAIVLDMIREFKGAGKTLITVTHDPQLTSWLADYLVLLKAGELVEQGPFYQVRNSTNRTTQEILRDVMGEAAAYDDDLLDLLGDNASIGFAAGDDRVDIEE